MLIDEEKKYALTHYFKKNGVHHKRDSDHNTLVMDLKVPVTMMKKAKKELFNFRNLECQKVFNELTNCSEKLLNCFKNDLSLSQQCNKWFGKLE